MFNTKREKYILLPCNEEVLAQPLNDREIDEMNMLIQERDDLEEQGRLFFISKVKRLITLRFRYARYNMDADGKD